MKFFIPKFNKIKILVVILLNLGISENDNSDKFDIISRDYKRILKNLLCAWSYILCIHLNLFLVIRYWSSSQFYNVVDVNYIFLKLLNLFLISNEEGNWSSSIFCIHFCNCLIIIRFLYFWKNKKMVAIFWK